MLCAAAPIPGGEARVAPGYTETVIYDSTLQDVSIAQIKTETPAPTRPIYERLQVEGLVAILDGKRMPLSSGEAPDMLQKMIDAKGQPLSATLLGRPDKVFRTLPKQIRGHISRPEKKGNRSGWMLVD